MLGGLGHAARTMEHGAGTGRRSGGESHRFLFSGPCIPPSKIRLSGRLSASPSGALLILSSGDVAKPRLRLTRPGRVLSTSAPLHC